MFLLISTSAELWLLISLFLAAITLHMVEEVIWLPGWSQDAGRWHEPVSRPAFGLATAIMLLFVYTLALWALFGPARRVAVYLLCGLAIVMIVNVIVPHLGATISQRRYAPGLATSVLLVVPTSLMLIHSAFGLGFLSPLPLVLCCLGCLVAAAVVWPRLFLLLPTQ